MSKLAPRRATAADVAFLHQLLLGRDARASELDAHAGQGLLELTAELANTWSHRDFMRRALLEDVMWLYREILHRDPESDEVIARRVGRPLLEVVLEFAQSEELLASARTATAHDVKTLFNRLLDRTPEGAAAVATRVGLPLLDVVVDVLDSPDLRAYRDLGVYEVQEWCTLLLGEPADGEWALELTDILRGFKLGRLALVEHLLRMHVRRLGATPADRASEASRLPQVLIREQSDYTPTRHVGSTITLVVPTIDSACWIGCLVDFYERIGIRPVYAVDSRTRDRTREILTSRKQDWIDVSGPAPRVESLLPGILGRISTPWVLRLDDDELPTPELLRFCDEAVERGDVPVWGFPRLSLRWSPARPVLEYSTFLAMGPRADMDRQWRLYKPPDVRLRDALHTPGFDAASRAPAPAGALMLHFDWIVRTPARRREKVASYRAQAGPGPVSSVLYETIPDEWHLFETLEHAPSVDFARSIYHASK